MQDAVKKQVIRAKDMQTQLRTCTEVMPIKSLIGFAHAAAVKGLDFAMLHCFSTCGCGCFEYVT